MTLTARQKVALAREKKNAPLRHVSLEMETSTHFPALMRCVELSEGPILELGSGLFSTPLLHWLCFAQQRPLLTLEGYRHYLAFAEKFRTDWHRVAFLDPKIRPEPGNIPHMGNGRFGVVFIDYSPKRPRTRGDDAVLFKDTADYVVMHDAGPESNPKYGYEEAYKHFKYRFDWTDAWPHTTVLSNFKDLRRFHV